MDLASRARAPVWALLEVFGGASVLDVNVGQSFFSAAACSAVFGVGIVGCSGRAGVKAAGSAGVGAFTDINFDFGLVPAPEKGAKRCAAGFSASMDNFERPERPGYVQDALRGSV